MNNEYTTLPQLASKIGNWIGYILRWWFHGLQAGDVTCWIIAIGVGFFFLLTIYEDMKDPRHAKAEEERRLRNLNKGFWTKER